MKGITPCLWFDNQAEEAATFYASVFEGSRITETVRYGGAGQEVHGGKPGSVMTMAFELAGRPFAALNGGPLFKFNEAISFQIRCESQEEVDYFWERLSEGGDEKAQQCGWLKDKFGLSWQVVPEALIELLSSQNRERADRAMNAMLKMKKFDIAALERAAAG
jgi:predicted 3-demethylubiquinone-9 3-methyltransferase (glyoxalase superfamily)